MIVFWEQGIKGIEPLIYYYNWVQSEVNYTTSLAQE